VVCTDPPGGQEPGGDGFGHRRAQPDDAGRALDQRVDRRIGNEVALADDDDPGRRQSHFAHQVAGNEDGPSLAGERLHQRARPHDAFGVEAVYGLVEDEDRRVPEERGGDTQTLGHTQRESAGLAAGHVAQAHEVEDLTHSAGRDVTGLGQCQEMVAGLTAGVIRLGVQQRSDLPHGRPQSLVRGPVYRRRAFVRVRQAKDQTHRGGLARTVGTEEARDDAGLHLEAQVVDGKLGPKALRKVGDPDQTSALSQSLGPKTTGDGRAAAKVRVQAGGQLDRPVALPVRLH
jgi:hypothetical protein